MTVGGYRVWPLAHAVVRDVAPDLLDLAAQTAFYFFTALFALPLFVVPLVGLVADEQRVLDWLLSQLRWGLPDDAFELVQAVVVDVMRAPDAPGALSLGALLTLWTGRTGFAGLMRALNRAYGVRESRPFWRTQLVAAGLVIGTGGLALVASTAVVVGPELVGLVGRLTGLGGAAETGWRLLRFPLALVTWVSAVWLLYYALPDVRQPARQRLAGAVLATLVWTLGTLGFRFYVAHVGAYGRTYGALGSVVVLLFWLFLTALAVLLGAKLNAELYRGTGRGAAASREAAVPR